MGNAGLFMNLAILTSRLTGLGSSVTETAEKNMEIACLDLEAEIKKTAPVDTGHLRGSYESVVERQGSTIIGHVGTNTEYAAYQEFLGTPHVRPSLDAKRDSIIRTIGAKTVRDAISHV